MRWNEASDSTDSTSPVLFGTKGLIRSVQTPEFSGITFH